MVRRKSQKIELVTVSGGIDGPDAQSADEDGDDRGKWDSQVEFILSCLGFAVGFGNVWRFPYLCYKNGGAVFLIPYVTMLICAGLPMFFMELCLGQYVGLGPSVLFPNMAPLFRGLGLAMPLISFYVSVYFEVIIAWSLYYTFSSFTDVLPWGSCDHDFNTIECATTDEIKMCVSNELNNTNTYYYNGTCLNIKEVCDINHYETLNYTCLDNSTGTAKELEPGQALGRVSSSEEFYKNGVLGVDGTSFDDMGQMQWALLGCLALGWIIVGAGLAKGVKSSGKAVYFTALFPYVVLTILLVVGLSQEGAQQGIDFYFLQPNLTKLGEVEVWTDASSQIFFSLGSAFGSLITLSSYNQFHNNCMRDAMIIATCNCLTSVYAGFVLFSILGALAYELNVPISEVVSSGSGLAFIAYPQAVLSMPPPQLWSILFFMMFITLGLSSQFAMVETVNTMIYDLWPATRKRKYLVVMGVCGLMFLLGIPMCLQGGVYLFELLNLYSAGISVIVLAITEIILVQYIYGHSKFFSHIENEIGIHIPTGLKIYWKITWLVLAPVSLVMILIMSLVFWVPAYWGDELLPDSAQTLGWLICFSSLTLFAAMALFEVFKRRGKPNIWQELLRPSEDLCPAHVRRRREKQQIARIIYNNSAFDMSLETQERRLSPIELATATQADKVSTF